MLFRRRPPPAPASPIPEGPDSALLADIRGRLYLDVLPELCRRRVVRNYLEIGVHFGHMLARIPCDTAIGVDPGFCIDQNVAAGKRRVLLYQTTSDGFFETVKLEDQLEAPLDLSFLDGLHQYEFLLRDFYNAEAASGAGSMIVMHDCLPLTVEMTARDWTLPRQDPEPYSRMWTGDVWKIVPILARYRPDLRVRLLDCIPTGLVCVTGLDPSSRVLRERYDEIVAEFDAVPNAADTIGAMYAANAVLSSAEIAATPDHPLFSR